MDRFIKYIRIFSEFYPIPLLLLVFTPLITGCFIDCELVDGRYIIINMIWLGLFSIPAAIFNKKSILKIAAIIYFITGFIEICHWIIIKGPLTVTSILVLSNTNTREAVEFLDLKATAGLLILIPFVLLFIYTYRNPPHYHQSKLKLIIGTILLLLSVIFISENAIHGRFIRKSTPQIAKVSLSFVEQMKLYNEVKANITPRQIAVTSSLETKKQTFVLIIGESCNRKHMSIYGASRITTPRLQSREDIIVFDDVVSPYSNTISSVLSGLSESNLENGMGFENCIDILDVFSSAGFETYWLSNQPPIGIWENMVTIFAKKADHNKFVNVVSNSSIEATLTTSYDSKLFSPFLKVLNQEYDKKFIVLHLMGSHSAYNKRYPSEFEIYKGSGKKEKLIAEYDNSIYYNDNVVDSLLSILDEQSSHEKNHLVTAIYFSDHGENVYDEMDRVGHDFSNELPKSNVEIPFILWISPNFSELNPGKLPIMESNAGKPYVTDDLFHAIMDINGIQSEYIDMKRSIFSDVFNDSRIRILEDGKDYDAK